MRGQLLISEWLYRALLTLYPKEFRAAYGQQMRQTFRDACRVAYERRGTGGLLALWLPTLLDLFKSALEERTQQGELTMSKSKLAAWAGPLTIVVGALWLGASLGDFAFQTGILQDEGLLGLVFIPFFLSFIPMLLALIGTRLRFHPMAGVLGKVGLTLSVAACAGLLVSIVATLLLGGGAPEVEQRPWLDYVAVACVLSIRLGYILFGVDALKRQLLPRGNLLPLLLGLTVVLSLPFEWFGVPAILPLPGVTPFLHFALTGVCWVLLGIALLNERREPQPTAVI